MSAALIGLVGVALGGIIAVAKDLIFYWVERRHNGQYAATRVITVLDDYVQKCIDVVSDDGASEGRPAGRTEDGEEFWEPQVDCPNPPTFPQDIDWRAINFRLMYRILALPNLARGTDRQIGAAAEYASPPGYDEVFYARQDGYASLGLEALNLIRELREDFSLPVIKADSWNPDWELEKYLREKQDEVHKRRQADAAANKMLIDEMMTDQGIKR